MSDNDNARRGRGASYGRTSAPSRHAVPHFTAEQVYPAVPDPQRPYASPAVTPRRRTPGAFLAAVARWARGIGSRSRG